MRKFLVIQRINCEPSAVPTSIKASPSQDSEQIQRIQSPSLKQLLGFKVFLRQSQSFFTLQWISANHVKIKLLSIKSTAPYNMKHHQKATLWFCLKKKKKRCVVVSEVLSTCETGFQRPRNMLKPTSVVPSIQSIPRQQKPGHKSAGVFLLLCADRHRDTAPPPPQGGLSTLRGKSSSGRAGDVPLNSPKAAS